MPWRTIYNYTRLPFWIVGSNELLSGRAFFFEKKQNRIFENRKTKQDVSVYDFVKNRT